MKKKRTSHNISEDLLNRLNKIPRNELPNKSELIEQLLEIWYKGYKNAKKELIK